MPSRLVVLGEVDIWREEGRVVRVPRDFLRHQRQIQVLLGDLSKVNLRGSKYHEARRRCRRQRQVEMLVCRGSNVNSEGVATDFKGGVQGGASLRFRHEHPRLRRARPLRLPVAPETGRDAAWCVGFESVSVIMSVGVSVSVRKCVRERESV